MANRISGKTYIVDSSGINLSWPNDHSTMRVHTITFWSTNTTGVLELSYVANTADIAVKMTNPNHFAATVDMHFGEPHDFDRLRVQTLTAGTAWLYLS